MDATLYCALKAAFHRGFEISTDSLNGDTRLGTNGHLLTIMAIDEAFEAWLQGAFDE